jgi:hypothetical protein
MSELNEDDDISFVRSVRVELIKDMTRGDKPNEVKMPGETKDRMVLLSALADMDRTSLNLKKIKSDEGLANKEMAAAVMIASMFKDPNIKNMGMVDVVDAESPEAIKAIPKFDTSMVDVAIVPGELDLQPANENFDEFMARQAKKA